MEFDAYELWTLDGDFVMEFVSDREALSYVRQTIAVEAGLEEARNWSLERVNAADDNVVVAQGEGMVTLATRS